MHITDIVHRIEGHTECSAWVKKHPKAYLVHVFRIDDLTWQIGFCTEVNKVTSFMLQGGDVRELPAESAFQEKKHKIPKLDLDDVKIDVELALEKAKQFQKKSYESHPPLKDIVILQHIEDQEDPVYNITFITMTYNTLNVRVSARDGSIVSHELTQIVQFSGKAS